ncbi:MAG: Ig-like domain-containing protein [Clostridia bacterium]|nr:Ig-like domain-containing protein [Clostridia bacterium]
MKRSMKTIISLLLLAMMLCLGLVNAMATTVEEEETPLASFHWVSDVHIEVNPTVYKQALQGMAAINADTNIGLIVTGDITDYCKDTTYTQFYGLTEHYSPVSAANTAIIMGNHDVRSASKSGWYSTPSGYNSETSNWEIAKNFYLSYNAEYMPSTDQVYHVKELGGYTFIMLNPEMDLKDAMYMSEEQLAWLEQTLAAAYAKDPQKPVFIVSHQALMDTHAGSNAYNQTIYVGEKTPEESNAAIKEILAKYPTSIFLSGHMHHAFATSVGVVRPYGSFVEAPALRDGGNGYEVQIYADRVVFRAVNYATGEYFPDEDITISVGDSNVSRIYQAAQKVLADADSYDATEIANIRALSDTLGGLITVSYDTVDSLENFYTATQHTEINEAAQNLRTALEDLSISIPAEGADVTLSAGETLQLTVSGAVSWTSNDQSIVTIDENGKLTALKKGETTVTVTTADGSVTCNVTVTVDTSAISNAIGVADTLKANVVTAETACGAGEGNLYVTAAEMQALNDALATAVTAKTDAATAAEVESAAAALDTALNTFRSVIKPGVAHEGESATATTCKYGCGTAIAAVASVTVDGVTTNYASLEAAITAAPAGGTVVLLSDITVDETITIDKALTVDGNGKLINAWAVLFKITANEATVEFQNLVVISMGFGDSGWIVWQDASKKVNIKITTCRFFSNGDVIFLSRPQAGYALTIENSTLTGGAELLQINYGNASYTVNITGSKLYSDGRIVYYYSGKAQINITSTDIAFASNVTSIRLNKGSAAYKFVLNDGTVIGAAFNVTRPDGKVISCPASTNVAFNLNSAETLTLSGNVTFNSGVGNAAFTSAGTVDLTAFTGAKSIRKSGNNYYFCDELADAVDNAVDGDIYTLCCDVTADALTVEKAITIDLNGNTLTLNSGSLSTAVLTGAEASVKDGDAITYYPNLADAIAAAPEGGTVVLLSNITVDKELTIDKALTVDGNGKLINTSVKLFYVTASGDNNTIVEFKNLDVISTGTGDGGQIVMQGDSKKVNIKITSCHFFSAGDVIYMKKPQAGYAMTIKNSTLVSGEELMQINESPSTDHTVNIIDSKLYAAKYIVYYYRGTGGQFNITSSDISFASGITNIIKRSKTPAYKFVLNEGTVIGAAFNETRPDGVVVSCPASTNVAFNLNSAETLTLSGNVKFYVGFSCAGTVDLTAFKGTQIIRLSGTTYYFYDTVDAAFVAKQDGDTLFAYVASSVQNKGYVTEEATDANGTTYYKVVGLDTTLIDSAIADATEKLNGVVVADKPCAVEVGAEYVLSQDTIDALNDEITAAQAAKTSVATGKDVLDAVQKLIDALETFENAINIGKEHTDEGNDHLCDYGCGERMGGACADCDTDNDHVCDYCRVTKLNDCSGGSATCTVKATCSVCGEQYGALAAHTPNADDGDCTTAITCSVCGTVTTPAKAAHTPGEDDGNCTTAVNCTECSQVAIEAKAAHTPGTDDGDCTTAITCSICGTETTPAKAAHTPGEDDGNCTTAVNCTECSQVAIEAKAAHTGGTPTCKAKAKCEVCETEYGDFAQHKDENTDHKCDYNCGKNDMGGACADSDTDTDHICDYCGVTKLNEHTGGSATCTAKAVCTVCGKAYGELAQHTYDGDTDASCNVCGAERTVENNTNGNENTANGNENNAQNGNTEAPAKKGLSGGAVAGIVIGAVTILGGTGFALFWFVLRKKKR